MQDPGPGMAVEPGPAWPNLHLEKIRPSPVNCFSNGLTLCNFYLQNAPNSYKIVIPGAVCKYFLQIFLA